MGLLTASTATGTLIFTPGLAALILLVYVRVPERPASIGTNGSLIKCGGGLERKRWLLEHEGVTVKS
jgi:hypothetical protein